MTWPMEQLLIKYYVIKHLMLLKIQNNIGTRELVVSKCFDKKSTTGGTVKNKNMSNQELAKELHRHVIRHFKN